MSDKETKKIDKKKLIIYAVLIVIVGITIPVQLMLKKPEAPADTTQTNTTAPATTSETQPTH